MLALHMAYQGSIPASLRVSQLCCVIPECIKCDQKISFFLHGKRNRGEAVNRPFFDDRHSLIIREIQIEATISRHPPRKV